MAFDLEPRMPVSKWCHVHTCNNSHFSKPTFQNLFPIMIWVHVSYHDLDSWFQWSIILTGTRLSFLFFLYIYILRGLKKNYVNSKCKTSWDNNWKKKKDHCMFSKLHINSWIIWHLLWKFFSPVYSINSRCNRVLQSCEYQTLCWITSEDSLSWLVWNGHNHNNGWPEIDEKYQLQNSKFWLIFSKFQHCCKSSHSYEWDNYEQLISVHECKWYKI